MLWSKLKTRLAALVAPELRERLDLHWTTFRVHHNDHGLVCRCGQAQEFWITIDKIKVFRASYCKFANEQSKAGPSYRIDVDELRAREIHSPHDVWASLESYLNMPPEVALRSTDPILRAMAMIDRRIGIRTMKQLKVTDDEHALVRLLYFLRTSAKNSRQ